MSSHQHRDEWLVSTLSRIVESSVLDELRASSEPIWGEVVRRGLATDDEILQALSQRFRMAIADLSLVMPDARQALSEGLARKYQVVPLTLSDHAIDVAIANPNDLDAESAIGFSTGKAVRMRLASPSAIAARIEEVYQPEAMVERLAEDVGESDIQTIDEAQESSDFELGSESSASRPVIKLVDHIISEGISQRASDIHLELREGGVQVTLRIDGVLRPTMTLPRAVGVPLVSRIKIMSGLDIADRLRPQDGRARVSIAGRRVDLRVSTLPASTGEKVVIRILDAGSVVLELDSLGIRARDLERILHLISLREGIILVTGPTGSGKTTTLYSALKTIQQRGVNIVTVEDPVEYKLNGIVQVQVNEKAGLTFAAALRSILRQDPDVVLVGEIRDRETAGIAIQASLTGHLVLSTLHTIDASSSVARLLDIGVEAYKIGAALKGVVAQRLVRRLCPHCRQPATEPLSPRMRRHIPEGSLLYRAGGCAECGNTGYKGRMALVEVLVADHDVERVISAGEPADNIAAAARAAGMRSLWDSGVEHVLDGATDLDELLRVVEVPMESTTPSRATPPAPQTSISSRPSALQPAPAGPRSRSPLGSGKHWAVQVPASPGRGVAAPTPHNGVATFSEAAFELLDSLKPAATAGHAAPTILVVDPDAEHAEGIVDHLAEAGYRPVHVRDGIEALDQVDHQAPDAILLALDLPRMDGWGVLSRLRSRLPTADLPVIVMANAPDEDTEVRAFEAGAQDFVVRPVSARVVAARLRLRVRATV